ncbi:bifunctional phosphoribosylaminoimidazolecarboxamide formyltransferase/IMP cyclohydrolase [Chitinispirillales bacterium ANBcel5]|uniref:bifunctional phosphoribosylaminoimidazolecarboxamide formyltransferase/IMP cyclohydrolase n=1 Tax=Cellulosispirillum alkaliphilum TaxID=3039283 RepID=UPI002A564B09|nr:bifunctional phosphoribosylaminoimidazolecarboxamide formyltransferase/IMP cyclohydrolase [Chitinispirillales bacterium ANBcel5]
MGPIKINRALISVSDKSGVVEFAKALAEKGVEILSTGGTWKKLKESGVDVVSVDSYTGHPEIMDGRVKTLHPRIHGGILAVRDNSTHITEMKENGIKQIDLVVVNLYPFEKTVAREDVRIEDAIENIDIGGPTMVRSSAKNHAYVTVVVDPCDYCDIIDELDENGTISFESRKKLAVKAFRHTADYDSAIDTYLSEVYLQEEVLRLKYGNGVKLRYGENPHQSASFYKDPRMGRAGCVAEAKQLTGKELSYNNIVDTDAALEAVRELGDQPAAAIIKHTNPCGYATGETILEALEAAWSGDPVSAFGSVVALSKAVDREVAEVFSGRFVEVLIAPDFSKEALDFLKQKSSSLRILALENPLGEKQDNDYVLKHIRGGLLRQSVDDVLFKNWECVTENNFPGEKEKLAQFAWKGAKHVKSNAIVLAQEYKRGQFRITGMGAGQPNRVDSLRKLALSKARENLSCDYKELSKDIPVNQEFSEFGDFVLASDAFFPFADSVEQAHAAGIKYIIQPGGSKRDNEVIDACNRFGIAMIFTGMRHFKH